MGLSGVSGPFRGAYNTFSFGTASIGANTGNLGNIQQNMWSYTLPAGMDIIIFDAQIFAGRIGTDTRVNLLAGGASILKNGGNTETAHGVGLTAQGQASTSMGSTTATLSTAVFGTTATSIIAPVTPSVPVNSPRFTGAYITGGATLCASVSNGATATNQVTCTLLWYPVSHPNVVRSAFE